jgi:hypothetical protein
MGQTVRTALLRRVFAADEDRSQFNAALARVCVLFEDLRIEISGAAERSLPALDVLDSQKDNWLKPELTGKYRQFYFIRRSLLTLREFAEALRLTVEQMKKDPRLNLTFRGLTDDAKPAWDSAIHFFDTNEKFLNGIRRDIGGHFGQKAALNAVTMLLPQAYGSIALAHAVILQGKETADQLRLHFAMEIVGTALLKHLQDGDIEQYAALLSGCIIPGYQHAINCVYILVREYLWDRFAS